MSNRLASETSPYLLQHKDNPVDWYPWGDEALERARTEDKPIFLSIGYAACHWCHVMERESFEDPETAGALNENFIAIKVDREERPDLDALYMEAVQMLTGHGGWPMSVFLTPDGRPFYGGTYFPPEDRYGMPSFPKLLGAIVDAWRDRRGEVEEQSKNILGNLGGLARLAPSRDPLIDQPLMSALRALEESFDAEWGGFGSAPKFPQPSIVDLLIRLGAREQDSALEMARRTLDAMASGGMFDQLAGGFARYSVDRYWLVPHFEKMLYDNAQLLRTYARSWQMTGSEFHREVASATGAWLLAELRDPAGGFYSSLDADSEGVEGKFYLWSLEEVRRVLGDLANTASSRWGFSEEGNFEGHNIPVLADPNITGPEVEQARALLLEERARRVRPATDTKVITAWNALVASAFAEAGMALGRPDWISVATEVMTFVTDKMIVAGRLMRSYGTTGKGQIEVRQPGFCEDYAYVLEACLALFEATGDHSWLRRARWVADETLRLFGAEVNGGFFTSGNDTPSLVTRTKDVIDDAIPAANSVLALQLQRLAEITGEQRYERAGIDALRLVHNAMERSPTAFAYALGALDHYTGNPLEIVIVGRRAATATAALVGAATSRYLPNKVLVLADPSGDNETIPLLEGRMGSTETTAYVCRRGVCRLPVTDPDALLAEIAAA